MVIRAYREEDLDEILKLFFDTVHSVNLRDYTKEQADAWAGVSRDELQKAAWARSLASHKSLVAEENGKITGFGDIDETGYLDRLYVHKDRQGCGIASALCDRLEEGFAEVTTHASLTARGFFERRGYRVLKEQQVERRGVFLKNFVMQKST